MQMMAGKEPGSEEWSAAMKLLIDNMRERRAIFRFAAGTGRAIVGRCLPNPPTIGLPSSFKTALPG